MDITFITAAAITVRRRTIFSGGDGSKIDIPIRYGVIRHGTLGPIVIDAGYAPSLFDTPGASLALRAYRSFLAPRILAEGAPERCLPRLGIDPAEVRHVILTHLHADHVGYLTSFPNARIHIMGTCLDELASLGRLQLAHRGIFPELLPADFLSRANRILERQTGKESAATPLGPGIDLFGNGDILAVPLPGHASGHIGLWLSGLSSPLLYATDTTWTLRGLMEDAERPLAVAIASSDRSAANRQRQRIRQFVIEGGRVALCHDPESLPEDLHHSDAFENGRASRVSRSPAQRHPSEVPRSSVPDHPRKFLALNSSCLAPTLHPSHTRPAPGYPFR